MDKNVRVGRVFGIDIYLHYSWFLIFLLLAYALATSFFPGHFPNLSAIEYYGIGIASSLLLFVSVLLHELSHSLVAKARNIEISKISLFFFGGIAHMNEKGITAQTELMMALAGPGFSLAFAGACFALLRITSLPLYIYAVVFYLANINLILAIFNLVPGFPLDGGRAFRAIVWMITGNYEKSTYIASRGGKFFGVVLIFLGIFNIIVVSNFGGLWLLLIGGFLYFLAEMSYEQVVIKKSLFRIPVNRIMLKRFASVSPEMSIDNAISRIFINAGQEIFPVMQGKNFLGLVSLDKIRELPVAMRAKLKIKSIMKSKSLVKKIKSTSNLYDALMHMVKKNVALLPVIEKGRLVGILTRDAVLKFVRLTLDTRKRK